MARRTTLRLFVALVLLALPIAIGQTARVKAAPDVPTYALVNARIVPVSSRPIPSGTLVLRDGKIAAIGANVDPPGDAIVMDADGWTLYPGFVDAHSALGMPDPPTLPQDNAARARAIQARQRAGEPTPGLTPQLEAVSSYTADRDALQAARNAGITAAAIAPPFGVFKGQSTIVTLRDGLLTDQVVRGQWAQHLGFQRLRGEYPGTLMGTMASIRQHYLDAQWYDAAWTWYREQPASTDRPAYDEGLEALQNSAGGAQPVVFTAWTENEIRRALKLADELGLDMIVSGAVEGWRAADALRAADQPVLVSLDLRPRSGPVGFGGGLATSPVDDPTTEDVADAAANAGRLHAAGVTVAFTGAGLDDPADYLDNFRTAVGAGLSRDGALRALTIAPAEILGVDDVLGSLEVGKAANVVAVEGEIFDAEARVKAVWVDGARYDADDDGARGGRQASADDEEEDDADDDDAEAPSRAELERRAPYGPLGGEVPATAVRHGTIMTAANGTISNGTVLIENGTITAVGPDAQVVIPAGAREIDATGMWVTPGLLDAHSHMSIEGGGNEGVNSVTPEVRIIDVINHRDDAIFRALAGGVTTINVLHGSANAIGGQNAILKMRWGKSADELLFDDVARGVKFALGENPTRASRPATPGVDRRYPGTRMGVEFLLRKSFADAREYQAEWDEYEGARARGGDPLAPRRDLRLEALSEIVSGEIQVHAHSYRADEILMLLRVAEDFGFRIKTLQHVLEGYKVADEIATHGAGASTFTDFWGYKMEAWDAIPYNMAIMHERGVTVSVNSDSDERVRRLYIEAAKAVKYGGVPEQEALQLVTLNAANHFGIDDRVGSIEVGKDGDLAIFTAHPFVGNTRVQYTLIEGQIYFDRSQVETTEDALSTLTPEAPAGGGEGCIQQDVDSPNARIADWTPPTLPPAVRAELMPASYGDVAEPMLTDDTTPIAIVGGRILTMTGAPIERGTIIIQGGRITAVGEDVRVPDDAQVIDAAGMTVSPGMINAGTSVGLSEIGAVSETNDTREIEEINSHVKASVAIHPDSEMIPIARANGVTTAIAAPAGGLIQGQSALIDMAGWTGPEVVARSPLAMHINFPEIGGGGGGPGGGGGGPSTQDAVDEQLATLRDWMHRARAHAGALAAGMIAPTEQTYTLDALVPVVMGELPVVLEASTEDGIKAALAFLEEFQLRGILAGTRDVWKVVDEIAEAGVPVILGPIQAQPADGDPYDSIFVTAKLLHDAGVQFAFRTGGASAARNLPDHAALGVAFGLPRDAAWHALTRGAAELLGIGDLYGSVEEGMIANLVVSEGDLLDIPTQVKHVLIRGQEVSLETHHTRLWEQYGGRPRPQQ